MEEVQGQEMKVSQRLALLIPVRRITRCVNGLVTETVLIPGSRPDRRRLEAGAPALSYDAGDALLLAGDV